MSEGELICPRGGMLYDPSRVGKPGDYLFSRDYWREHGELREVSGGRGSVAFVSRGRERWVWRHYRRGGLVASVLGDRYLYTGRERTRAYREFRLLAELSRRGLPVPAPIAARFERTRFLFYRADLMTVELPPVQTLADAITGRSLPADRWEAIGAVIARFHRAGVQHADLNAHNVLVDVEGAAWVLDFDRGRLRTPGDWAEAVLARLKRSLEKIRGERDRVAFGDAEWSALRRGHDA
jgi:3-deoxy-D-manno-octulosonic acid kinase